MAKERLKGFSYDYELIKVLSYELPFKDSFFDFVITYETIEHIGDTSLFVSELSRVLKPNGIMILTCPNILWEPVHWIAAIFNIHHSEGPHNFLRRCKLLKLFHDNGLGISDENTTVIFPFNSPKIISFNEIFEKILPKDISKLIGLRRTFVLVKI